MNSSKRTERSNKRMAIKKKPKSSLSNVSVSRLENTGILAELSSPGRKALNTIPTGNQLPRTPVKKNSLASAWTQETQEDDEQYISHLGSDVSENPVTVRGNLAKDRLTTPAVPEQQQRDEAVQRKPARRPSAISAAAQLEEMDPDHFIRGMQGYQWTATDLEFVEHTKIEREIQQLKSEMNALLKQLKDEQQRRDLSLASREKVQADLTEIAAFELMTQLARDFLCQKLTLAEVEDLDPKSLMALIRVVDVRRAVEEERSKVETAEKLVTRAQDLRHEQDQESKRLELKILQKQAKVDGLKSELSELKAKQAAAEETLRATRRRWESIKGSKPTENESEVDMAKVLRRSKRIAKRKENFLEREAILKNIRSLN